MLIPRSADDHAEPTRSELERALLPAPLVNHHVRGKRSTSTGRSTT
jgi:hypothetical protein